MIRILFVDDEPEILADLQRRLHPHHDEWDMHFAEGGAAAVEQLAETAFDVIVADMTMPIMDGATLLGHAKRTQPAAVRIILSGQSGEAGAMRSVAVAHQFLSKPCEPHLLRSVIQRSIDLRSRLADPEVLAILGSLPSLPSPSVAMAELQEVLGEASIDTARVSRVVSSDVAMSTKLLQIVNSSFYGLSRGIDDPGEAVRLLGAPLVGEILLSVGLLDAVAGRTSSAEQQLREMRERSLARADLAASLAERAGRATSVIRRVWNGAFLVNIGEMLLLGTDHEHDPEATRLRATIGGALLAMWGLPQHLVETVALSDLTPQSSSSETHLYTWLATVFLGGDDLAEHDEAQVADVVRWTGLASADLSAYRNQTAAVG